MKGRRQINSPDRLIRCERDAGRNSASTPEQLYAEANGSTKQPQILYTLPGSFSSQWRLEWVGSRNVQPSAPTYSRASLLGTRVGNSFGAAKNNVLNIWRSRSERDHADD